MSPAIPFESLITNRLEEPDTSKWVTKIYYPFLNHPNPRELTSQSPFKLSVDIPTRNGNTPGLPLFTRKGFG